MNARIDKLKSAAPEVREAALSLLDEISAPMTARELDKALLPYVSRSLRRDTVKALKYLHIIAIVPGEQAVERG
ncbi:MAG: hypothetical protein C0429_17345 [Sphingopyxis sp.]|nr:hypothetical protein [Sphingopyxis sp.]